MVVYIVILILANMLSWVISGSVEKAIQNNSQTFWSKMHMLAAVWTVPIIAGLFAPMLSSHELGKAAIWFGGIMSLSMIITAGGRMAVMHSQYKIKTVKRN